MFGSMFKHFIVSHLNASKELSATMGVRKSERMIQREKQRHCVSIKIQMKLIQTIILLKFTF